MHLTKLAEFKLISCINEELKMVATCLGQYNSFGNNTQHEWILTVGELAWSVRTLPTPVFLH